MTTAYYYSLILSAAKKAGYDSISVDSIKDLKRIKHNKKRDIVINGTIKDGAYLLMHGYKRVFTWFQGIVEERKMQHCSAIKVFTMTLLERILCKKSEFCIFVSNAEKEHFETKYKTSWNDNYYILPCFNETHIYEESFRKPNTKTVFSYTGGFGVWQCLDQTLELYKMIESKCSDVEFDFFTNNPEKGKALLTKHGIQNCKCEYVTPEKLNIALKDVSFGFVLREDDPVNNVATPTKFSTYLANGVIPIYTAFVKDFSEMMKSRKFRIELPSLDLSLAAEQIIAFMQQPRDENELKEEYKSIFEDYYCEKKHLENLSAKLGYLKK